LNILERIRWQLPLYNYHNGELSLNSYIDTIHSFCDNCLDNFDYVQMWFAEYLSGACDGLNCQNPLNSSEVETVVEARWTL